MEEDPRGRGAGRPLTDVQTGAGDQELDPRLWGPAPSPAEIAAATRWLSQAVARRKRSLAERSVTVEAAATLLDVDPSTVEAMLSRGDLVGFDHHGATFLPQWQFDSAGSLPGVPLVIAAFRGNPVALSRWMTTKNPNLGGATPAQALAVGEAEKVADLAATLTATGW